MSAELKQRVDDSLRFDADYIAQIIKGGSLIARTKKQQQEALKHVIENMQSVIKELTEREAKLVEQLKDKEEAIQGYVSHLEYISQSFCILLNLIKKQGWGETTEYNYEFFEEDIFPVLGVNSFAEIGRKATLSELGEGV